MGSELIALVQEAKSSTIQQSYNEKRFPTIILIVFIYYIVIIRVIVSRTVPWLEGTKVIANFSRYKFWTYGARSYGQGKLRNAHRRRKFVLLGKCMLTNCEYITFPQMRIAWIRKRTPYILVPVMSGVVDSQNSLYHLTV